MTRSIRLIAPILLLQLVACASTPRDTADICAMFEDRRSWFRAAQKAEDRWQVPVPVMMAFIRQESGFKARARPARRKILGFIPGSRPSDAMGYAQALESTWREYESTSGNRSARRSKFADAVDFIGWYNHNSYLRNTIRRDDAYNLYLAYHEGNGGFRRGTYAGKQWLLDTAARVQANANLYERQLAQCERELGRGWLRRLLS